MYRSPYATERKGRPRTGVAVAHRWAAEMRTRRCPMNIGQSCCLRLSANSVFMIFMIITY